MQLFSWKGEQNEMTGVLHEEACQHSAEEQDGDNAGACKVEMGILVLIHRESQFFLGSSTSIKQHSDPLYLAVIPFLRLHLSVL